ncbi:zf-HC2 domain-containing protein [Actinoplanes sp. NPDC051851]|uniref:anti-sigma factor n=1 Tax=Actinoplanes sp. NPDC051851 TaxID=3154753 RepID=UPI00341FEC62
MRCEDGHDDAAYVLGALSPAERAAYESHLATCSFCREAVADLSRVPDMLDRLDADEFVRLLDPSLSPPRGSQPFSTSFPGTRQPRPAPVRTFPIRLVSTFAAAVLVLILGGGVAAWVMRGGDTDTGQLTGPAVAMTPTQEKSPISATIRLSSTAGGTKVEMTCSYSDEAEKPYTFKLIAYGPDDEEEQLGSWVAQPGSESKVPGVTHIAMTSLDRLDLVRFDGKVMLTYKPRS